MRFVSICLLVAFAGVCSADEWRITRRGGNQQVWVVTETAKPAPVAPASTATECADALSEVNAARAARGLPAFQHDPLLTQAAYACAKERASRGIHGHLESDFVHLPAGAKADAAGCAALEPSWQWQSCCWDSPEYTTAGAAWVMSGGLRFMHIFVRTDGVKAAPIPPAQSAPTVYQSSAGDCASGTCGAATFSTGRRGIFRRR